MINTSLDSLNEAEWEMLCDCCGLCCLYKVQDEDTGEVFYTKVVCPLLNRDSSRCKEYPNRFAKMPSCTKISAENLMKIAHWLPKSCAYRCLAEGVAIPDWHPIFSDLSSEAAVLRDKLSKICIRPNTSITKTEIDRIIRDSFAPRSFHRLNRLLLANVIEDADI